MRRVPPEMFRFTTVERSDLYGAVLDAFGVAGEHLETALGLDAVRERLRGVGWAAAVEDEELHEALRRLVQWELLDVVHNHAENYRTAEEYERRNLQYSLTRRGEAALAGVRHALEVLASTGALQTAVLEAIADRLDELCLLSGEPASADRRIYTTLRELEGHLEALVENTKAFNGELQRLLRAEGADLEVFREVKAATVAYLQEFLVNLDRRGQTVAAAVARVEERGTAVLRERALRGAELPPVAGEDPAAGWLESRRARWAGLRAWFLPDDGARPRIEQLHDIARRAIVSLLQVLERINESRRRSSSAVQDFRELARWFAAAPVEEDLHRLWSAAFGLGPARHAHLAHPDPELIPSSHSWSEAPPVRVSALLRTSGRTERFTRTARVRDVAAVRAERAERARAERAELARAWRVLETDGPVRLSAFGALDPAVFDRLLDLLGRALSARPDAGGLRRATTGDGRVEIALSPPPDERTAVLRTAKGALAGPDYVVHIMAAGGASAFPAFGAARQEAAG
ncbi:TIGR02677 family protein [Streptomyces ipomoeae]|uniref:TIGR02677 family protein n=1 Tax=Streptomyces ipomoeae TaxID=103232 RepID=UPI001146FE9B|nr:TIGR02677 family protein [Streptomyces ipomoeae]MDX2932777.1 TIGR02677 family protein [Streptomyces ipomoeae]TQE22858.1 TIGR02677 family protein [Streptomyces ipomoeae]